jgi:hypothetical protein
VVLKLRECLPKTSVAVGASLAEQHMESVHKAVEDNAIAPGALILLDFSGIDIVNGSYIKSTALWLLTCGQLSASNSGVLSAPRHRGDPRPCDLYVIVAGLSPDVTIEFQDFFKPRRLPLLAARHLKSGLIEEAALLGHLDPILTITLKAALRRGPVTAPDLHRAFPDGDVTVTAWNNRLNELHALRLLRRIRAGRAWKYEPIVKRIVWE